ncbi:MAG: 1,4-alpha-glucan branching protein GlgB [Boseongicola sp.]|nr:1,4-alpha-glucan branching protein GlgB [Boseongicola sp.]
MLEEIDPEKGKLSKSHRKIAVFVREHPKSVIKSSLAELAAATKVSEPTIIRFCRSVGCDGFKDFKIRLAQSLSSRAEAGATGDLADSPTEDSIHYLTARNRELLARLELQNRSEVVEDVVDAIAKSGRLRLFASSECASIASAMRQALSSLGISTQLDTSASDFAVAISQSGPDDVILMLSETGRSQILNRVAEVMTISRITRVAVAPVGSPLLEKATLQLALPVMHDPGNLLSLAHLATLCDLICNVLRVRIADRPSAQRERLEELTRRISDLPGQDASEFHPVDLLTADRIMRSEINDLHAVLGIHTNKHTGVTHVATFAANAKRVEMIDRRSGKVLQELDRVGSTDVFSGEVKGRRRPPDYRLRQTYADGHVAEIDDPYRFRDFLGEWDIYFLGEGSHMRLWEALGAHPCTIDGVDGTRFVMWAERAERVSVIGDFNDWDTRSHVLRRIPGASYWEIFVPALGAGSPYKFAVKARDGRMLERADPFARQAQLRPGAASVVAETPAGETPANWIAKRRTALTEDAPMSIYEVHLGSWHRGKGGDFLTYDEIARQLIPYVVSLGFTHIELMPISEHPYDGSWGYQTTGYFAPTARFGDAQGFRRFVDSCHQANVGVVLDWVPAHFAIDEHGLARFDGAPLFEYADDRKACHPDWGTYVFDYAKREVGNFLIANALYWLEVFDIDGLRVDAVSSMLYRDHSGPYGQWLPNRDGGRENFEAIDFMRRLNQKVREAYPDRMVFAEESGAWPGVTAPPDEGGLGFHCKWNMGWMKDTLEHLAREPVHRTFYHGELTFGFAYSFDESYLLPLSHDEVVHGKKSLLNKMPGDHFRKLATLRAYLGFMWGHPGKKLLFMGSEFAAESEWNHDVGLDWSLLEDPSRAAFARMVRALNDAYAGITALHSDRRQEDFRLNEDTGAEESIVSFERFGAGSRALVVSHFSTVARECYRVGVSRPGRWHLRINTDDLSWGGSGAPTHPVLDADSTPWNGCAWSVETSLPPLATLIYEAE